MTRLSALLVAPGLLVSTIFIWRQPWALESKLILLGAELLLCLVIGAVLHDHIIRPLQTLANVVGAVREEDYSFRARLAVPNDALGELSIEVNMLADILAQHRTGAMEATALLQSRRLPGRTAAELGLPSCLRRLPADFVEDNVRRVGSEQAQFHSCPCPACEFSRPSTASA